MFSTPDELANLAKSALRGAKQGGIAGVLLSVVTGTAVVATAPAWLPFVGGCAAVSTATVAAWGGVGAAVGAAAGGVCEAVRQKKLDDLMRG